MASQPKYDSRDGSAKLWNMLMGMVYLFLFTVIFSIGYLLLGDHIEGWLHPQTYSPEQITKMNQRAIADLSLEKEQRAWNRIENGIHLRTGLHDDPHLQTVISVCTSCHSAKLITQNRATRSGWESMIRWMQRTQGLPDLGREEPKILDYLATYYAPQASGRRQNLNIDEIEWYVLHLDQ